MLLLLWIYDNESIEFKGKRKARNNGNHNYKHDDFYPNGKSVTNHKTAANTKTLGDVNLSALHRFTTDPS